MRWSYKTVNFELKKEGLLGSAFLDASEVELTLNEYGKAGWELVSMIETQEGLIAIFKQPLEIGIELPVDEPVEDEFELPPVESRKPLIRTTPVAPSVGHRSDRTKRDEAMEEFEIEVDEKRNRKDPDDDIGAIRIE